MDRFDPEEAKERIAEWARALGFSSVRIAPAERPLGSGFLLEWLRRGMHAGMRYMEPDPDGRCDPGTILEGCQSVLCLAMPYDARTPDPGATDPALARIARYAWGDDYHVVVKEKLEALRAQIVDAWPQARTRAAVDSSPVLEKALAAAAGIGWMGKHTNIIDPERGSWFFLAEIFTTLPLAPDAPIADHCGSCTRCIDACPTGAIVEPYVLDARRCISYWTIEHRGAFAPGIARGLENWVFGCDVCQDVCPWNARQTAPDADPRFGARDSVLGRTPEEWESIPRDAFRALFRGSAVVRAKHEGFIRNARAVAANVTAKGGRNVTQRTERLTIPRADGGRPLAADLHHPVDGIPRAGILLVHGFKGFKDWGFFPYVCERLAAAGFLALRFNMGGSGVAAHGDRFDDPEAFETNTYGKELDDTRAALRFLAERMRAATPAGARIGLLGHSRGGGMALVTAAETAEVSALVTWAGISQPDRFGDEANALWERGETVPVMNARTGQVFRIRRDFWDDLRRQQARLDLLARASEVRVPWLIVQGGADETVRPDEARALHEAARAGAGRDTTRLLTLEGTGHTFDAGHPFAGANPSLDRAIDATVSWFLSTLA